MSILQMVALFGQHVASGVQPPPPPPSPLARLTYGTTSAEDLNPNCDRTLKFGIRWGVVNTSDADYRVHVLVDGTDATGSPVVPSTGHLTVDMGTGKRDGSTNSVTIRLTLERISDGVVVDTRDLGVMRYDTCAAQ